HFSSIESGTESWWIDRNRFACQSFAAVTRLKRLGLALPAVTRSLVSLKPSAFNFSSICRARRRLKANSGTLRALLAPSDSAVCPTSRAIRNFAGSQLGGVSFKFKLAGPNAASLTCWELGATSRVAERACFDEACFGEASWLEDLSCFDEPLKRCDEEPAVPGSIGRSTDAQKMQLTTLQRRAPRPERSNFRLDDRNPLPPGMISLALTSQAILAGILIERLLKRFGQFDGTNTNNPDGSRFDALSSQWTNLLACPCLDLVKFG